MMIHNSWGLVIGNAEDMRELADRLDKHDANIASIYADRAGGTAEDWLELMSAETWFSAEEAVEAGLADRVEESSDATDAKAKVDLSVFNHAGRAAAPAPKLPAKPKAPPRHVARGVSVAQAAAKIHNAPVRGSTPKEGEMQFSEEQLTELRNKLGLADDQELSPDAVLAALGEPASAGDQPTNDGGNPPPAPPAPGASAPRASGTITVDQAAWDEREDRIKRLEANDAKRRRDERDQVIAQAVRDGKFPPARKDHWVRLWDADPEGTREAIAGLARNVVPVTEIGVMDGDDEAIDQEFAHLFPPVPTTKGA